MVGRAAAAAFRQLAHPASCCRARALPCCLQAPGRPASAATSTPPRPPLPPSTQATTAGAGPRGQLVWHGQQAPVAPSPSLLSSSPAGFASQARRQTSSLATSRQGPAASPLCPGGPMGPSWTRWPAFQAPMPCSKCASTNCQRMDVSVGCAGGEGQGQGNCCRMPLCGVLPGPVGIAAAAAAAAVGGPSWLGA